MIKCLLLVEYYIRNNDFKMKEKFVLYGHPIIPISRIIEVFKIISL